jgi:phage shock protein A
MKARFLLLCLLVAIGGCGARMEVAKDKVLAQVDALLGEIDVKRKEAEIGIRNMDAGLDQLKVGKIEAKVKQTQFSNKATELEGKIADADKVLGRLRDYLKENKDVTISGKTFTPAQLNEMADTAISARKNIAVQLEAVKSARDRLGAVVASLEQREKDGRDKIKELKQHLEEIDAKAVALKSIKDAASLSGGGAAFDFEKVEKQVKDLSTKIDTELAFHDEKVKEAGAAPEVGSLESVIRQTSTAGDKISEIDKILGKK